MTNETLHAEADEARTARYYAPEPTRGERLYGADAPTLREIAQEES